jgi:hypothetical protein
MTYIKPLPDISEANAPFWEGLKRHEFLVPKCMKCGAYNWVPYPACRECLSERQHWTKVSGQGRLYSFTIVHRGPGAFTDDLPYVVAYAEFEEGFSGPRPIMVMGNLKAASLDEIQIGQPIEVAYEDIAEHAVTMWRFVLR